MDKIGKYQIIQVMGKGAMGIVYKALDPDINRTVAIKTVHFDSVSTGRTREDLVTRFMREAQAVGCLSHPNIVMIHDVGREGDLTYIVMQLVEGRSLERVIDSGRKFTPEEVLQLLAPICQALDYAHRKGIIHRDIKPANILLDESGEPYLVDFGVARMATSTVTQTGTIVGTPSYMSPEQVLGKKVDRRADIFSLGVILFELLAGSRPFEGEEVTTVLYKIVHEEPRSLTEVKKDLPAGFEFIIKRALAKDPGQRYQSCQDLLRDLTNVVRPGGETIAFRSAAGAAPGAAETTPGPAPAVKPVPAAPAQAAPVPVAVAEIPPSPAPAPEAKPAVEKPKPGPAVAAKPKKKPPAKVLIPAGAVLLAGAIVAYLLIRPPSPDPVDGDGAPPVTKEERNAVPAGGEESKPGTIGERISAGVAAYDRGDFVESLRILDEVLKLAPADALALRVRALADEAMSKQDILQILDRQIKAEEAKDLAGLLADVESPDATEQRQEDALLLFTNYDSLRSRTDGAVVKLLDQDRAELTFSALLTGVYKRTGESKILFEGERTWSLKRQGRVWKVADFRVQ
jgi:serine/threonine-protein kinase